MIDFSGFDTELTRTHTSLAALIGEASKTEGDVTFEFKVRMDDNGEVSSHHSNMLVAVPSNDGFTLSPSPLYSPLRRKVTFVCVAHVKLVDGSEHEIRTPLSVWADQLHFPDGTITSVSTRYLLEHVARHFPNAIYRG